MSLQLSQGLPSSFHDNAAPKETIESLCALSWKEMLMHLPDPIAKKNSSSRRVTTHQFSDRESCLFRFSEKKLDLICSQADLDEEMRQVGYDMMISMPPVSLQPKLQEMYKTYEQKSLLKKGKRILKKSDGVPILAVSSYELDFLLQDDTFCPLNEDMTSIVSVKLKSGKGKYHWWLPPPHPSYSITVTPDTGSFKKKGLYEFEITVNFKKGFTLEQIITIETGAYGRYYFLIRLRSESSVFGEDLSPYVDRLPPTLITMKEYLDRKEILDTPGLFFEPGNEEEILEIRDKFNRGLFSNCRDPHSLAQTLLDWFGEREPLLLDFVVANEIPAAVNHDALCWIETMEEPFRGITHWVISLIGAICSRSEYNNSSLDSLCELFTSKLYSANANGARNDKQSKEKIQSMKEVIAILVQMEFPKISQNSAPGAYHDNQEL